MTRRREWRLPYGVWLRTSRACQPIFGVMPRRLYVAVTHVLGWLCVGPGWVMYPTETGWTGIRPRQFDGWYYVGVREDPTARRARGGG